MGRKKGGATGSEEAEPSSSSSRPYDHDMKKFKDLVERFDIDQVAEVRLAAILSRCDDNLKKEYYKDLARHFEASVRPSATAMVLTKKMQAGEPLGRPGGDKDDDRGGNRDRRDKRKRDRSESSSSPPRKGAYKTPTRMGRMGKQRAIAVAEGAKRLRMEVQANLIAQMRAQNS
eukprot:TRINITY_DN43844_c0_g1_i1.p1 TRINITY_DN43844_c0_g1~~TRINITY_DN43844_c0_g1_i1.p1  ORF type:complete len:174 (+),score=32.30 TRINITY_DN43844_c0_g1_i1:99-620(+)